MRFSFVEIKLYLFILASALTSRVSLAFPSGVSFPSTSSHQPKGHFTRLVRRRRETCPYGNYTHDGQICCQCGAGYYLESPCPKNQLHGKCQPCPSGQYSSHANSQKKCEICQKCDHPNANLVEDKPCSPVSDAICRCKKNHYCKSEKEPCNICYSCTECGDNGVKIACTDVSDTVCNEARNDGKIVAVVFGVILLAVAVAVGLWFYFTRCRKRQLTLGNSNNRIPEEEVLYNKDIQHCLPVIAEVLGWVDAQELAISSGMTKTQIDDCRIGYLQDEQTVQLLLKWHDKEGRNASQKLMNFLVGRRKKGKAEKVMDILCKNDSDNDKGRKEENSDSDNDNKENF